MSIINPSGIITKSHQLDHEEDNTGHNHLQINSTSEEPSAAATAAAGSADSIIFSSEGDHDDNDPTTGVISDEDDEEDDEEDTTIATTMEITATIRSRTVSECECQENEENDITMLQRLVLDGLYNKLSYQERCEIENEIHGVQSMGLLLGADDEGEQQEGYSTLVQNALEEFAYHLEYTLLLDDATATATATAAADPDSSSSSSASDRITSAYEICLQRQYTYVTQYDSQLKLMCLRADLWKNPQHSVVRFLNHLNLLQKYYGSDALQSSRLSLSSCLSSSTDSTTSTSPSTSTAFSSYVDKRKRKSTKNKELSPEMAVLKSGEFQTLPSKDRSGRRVVIFQEQQPQQQTSSTSSSTKITQQQRQHARFKAMLYFFSTIARNDIDAQRDGLILIINTSSVSVSGSHITTNATSNYDDDDVLVSQSFQSQQHQQSLFNDFFQALPIRFSAIHFCYDQTTVPSNNTNNNVIQSNNMLLLKSLVYCDDDSSLSSCVTSTTMSRQRIRFHDSIGNIATANNEARNQLATYGIPVHEIPATSTGTIKVKQHSLWIKMQLWFDKQNNNMQNYNKQRRNEYEQMFSEEQQEHYKSLSPFQWNHKNRSSMNKERFKCTNSMRHTSTTCTAAASATAVIIECPNVNDVLFQQGGKFWNDNNKHQRGNLEFMDIIESKIIHKYQQVGQSLKKKQILTDLINEYSSATANENGVGISGRFLEDASQSSSLLPAGTWIELPLDSPLLLQKIRSTLANHVRRLENNNKNNKKSKSKSKIKTINNYKRRRLLQSSSSSLSSINGCTSIVSSSSSSSSSGSNDTSSSSSSIDTSNKKKQKVRGKFTTPQSEILVDANIADDQRVNKECNGIFGVNFGFQLS